MDDSRTGSPPARDLSIFPVAGGFLPRLLGLAWRRRSQAGPGLLIPRCSSIHTFGMRFELDVYFLGDRGRVLEVRHRVPPRRLLWCRGANAVLEIPAAEGGELGGARDLDAHAP